MDGLCLNEKSYIKKSSLYKILRSINKPCLAAKLLSLEIDMKNVQRSTLDEGAKALKVEPQANGGRKILAHYLWDDI